MNKLLKILFTFVILCTLLTACVQQPHSTNPVLSQIYEISDSYSPSKWINSRNAVTNYPISQIEDISTADKTEHIHGKQLELSYVDTLHYPVGNISGKRFKIQDSEKGDVLFNEDGSLLAIRYFAFAKLENIENASIEEIQNAVRLELADMVNFSEYANWSLLTSAQDDSGAYTLYAFVFYNAYNGYMTDYVKVSLLATGEFSGIWIVDPVVDAQFDFQIDKEKEQQLLEIKVNDLAANGATLKKYELMCDPIYTTYNSELCVQYVVSISMDIPDFEEDFGFACKILIPVNLMISE